MRNSRQKSVKGSSQILVFQLTFRRKLRKEVVRGLSLSVVSAVPGLFHSSDSRWFYPDFTAVYQGKHIGLPVVAFQFFVFLDHHAFRLRILAV